MAVDAGHVRVVRRINVAIRANGIVMRQSPIGVVVECGPKPARSGMASRTSRRESCRDVIWNVSAKRHRALPCRCVTAVAIRRQISRIVVVDVARRARRLRWIGMRTRQGESCRAVVEFSGSPSRDRVARRTHRGRVREPRRNMIRNCAADRRRTIPCSYVATVAVRRV